MNSLMFAYTLYIHQKHNNQSLIAKLPVLDVFITSTKTQTYTESLVAKILSLTCVHIFLKKPKHKNKG